MDVKLVKYFTACVSTMVLVGVISATVAGEYSPIVAVVLAAFLKLTGVSKNVRIPVMAILFAYSVYATVLIGGTPVLWGVGVLWLTHMERCPAQYRRAANWMVQHRKALHSLVVAGFFVYVLAAALAGGLFLPIVAFAIYATLAAAYPSLRTGAYSAAGQALFVGATIMAIYASLLWIGWLLLMMVGVALRTEGEQS